jgi:hypothetical protein
MFFLSVDEIPTGDLRELCTNTGELYGPEVRREFVPLL